MAGSTGVIVVLVVVSIILIVIKVLCCAYGFGNKSSNTVKPHRISVIGVGHPGRGLPRPPPHGTSRALAPPYNSKPVNRNDMRHSLGGQQHTTFRF